MPIRIVANTTERKCAKLVLDLKMVLAAQDELSGQVG
jgi:hypothetical protein